MSIIDDTLATLAATPEPKPLGERPHIVYAKDVQNPVYMRKLRDITAPVYWTTAAVLALIEKFKTETPSCTQS